jgi:hypothetical protein
MILETMRCIDRFEVLHAVGAFDSIECDRAVLHALHSAERGRLLERAELRTENDEPPAWRSRDISTVSGLKVTERSDIFKHLAGARDECRRGVGDQRVVPCRHLTLVEY